MDWSNFKFNFSFRPKSADKKNKAAEEFEDNYEHPIAREVSEAEAVTAEQFTTESLTLEGGLTLLKGSTPPATVAALGASHSDLVPGKYEGGLKLWECTVDLIETLRREIQDGRLSFRGKDVLELGCGHGLPGILACTKGAARVHFQDFNVDVLVSLTIPNVKANIALAKSRPSRPSSAAVESAVQTPRAPVQLLEVRYFAGDWEDMGELLNIVDQMDSLEAMSHREAFHPVKSFEDLSKAASESASDVAGATTSETTSRRESNIEASASGSGRSSLQELLPGSVVGLSENYDPPSSSQGTSSRSSWREKEKKKGIPGGYDVILMSETVYNPASLPKLSDLVKKCLRPPHGVLYVAAKKYYFGVGGGIRMFKSIIEEDGTMAGHMLAEFVDGMSNVREIWKFFFRAHK